LYTFVDFINYKSFSKIENILIPGVKSQQHHQQNNSSNTQPFIPAPAPAPALREEEVKSLSKKERDSRRPLPKINVPTPPTYNVYKKPMRRKEEV
jgi:hypothetical protein